MSNTQSLLINSCGLLIVVVLIPFFGWLSDFLGRPFLICLGSLTLLSLSIVYFKILALTSFSQALFAHMIVAIPCASIFAASPVLITEIFPLSIRCSLTNLIYSVAACLGGGVTPIIAFKLGHFTNYFPAFILVFFGVVNLLLLGIYMKRNALTPKLILIK